MASIRVSPNPTLVPLYDTKANKHLCAHTQKIMFALDGLL